MEKIFSSNISQRSAEGNITKNQWSVFKRFCIWGLVAIVIALFIIVAVNGIFYLFNIPYKSYYYVKNIIDLFLTIFFIIISFIALFKFFYCSDNAVNNFLKRKVNFYHTAYTALSEKYSFTHEELAKLKILKEGFEEKCCITSYYLMPIGLFGPVVLMSICMLSIVFADSLSYNEVSVDNILSAIFLVFLLCILIFIVCFAVPAKRRMSIWYIINTNEKAIVDEISRLLISKNIIERPLDFEVNDKFQKNYALLIFICIFIPMMYFVIEIDNANIEKKYLKMIYPVEDKLLEILEY